MAYNIAFGSSNGINVDLKFGETDHFYIYRVDGQDLQFLEIRHVEPLSARKSDFRRRNSLKRKPSRSSISK